MTLNAYSALLAPPPRFTHDCKKCVYLGQHGPFDLYACGKPLPLDHESCADFTLATVIARHGSDGPEYASGLATGLMATPMPFEDMPYRVALRDALRRALFGRRFVVPDWYKNGVFNMLAERFIN
jgi:hypothetical protein